MKTEVRIRTVDQLPNEAVVIGYCDMLDVQRVVPAIMLARVRTSEQEYSDWADFEGGFRLDGMDAYYEVVLA